MRALAVLAVLVALVGFVQAEEPSPSRSVEHGDAPAFLVDLQVSLPTGASTSDDAFSLIEDIRAVPHLSGLDLRLQVRNAEEPRADIAATFTFESLSEVMEWHGSAAVRDLLDSMEKASGEPVELHVRGKLVGA